jgi:hypothetical protein
MPTTHILKSWPDTYIQADAEAKTVQLRFNDRDYRVGDVVVLQEYVPTREEWEEHLDEAKFPYANEDFGDPGFTGQQAFYRITRIDYDIASFGLKDGFVALSLLKLEV